MTTFYPSPDGFAPCTVLATVGTMAHIDTGKGRVWISWGFLRLGFEVLAAAPFLPNAPRQFENERASLNWLSAWEAVK